jgi:hypothetical protein
VRNAAWASVLSPDPETLVGVARIHEARWETSLKKLLWGGWRSRPHL